MKIRYLLILFLVPVSAVIACLNTSSTSPTQTNLDGGAARGQGGYDASQLRQRMKMGPADLPNYDAVKSRSTPAKQMEADALDLIFVGDYARAVPLLQKAEETAPGDYSIAANLGTTYELVGDNAAALSWIREAIRRNPDSHRGTEWVHILVLEAKIRESITPGTGLPEPLIAIPERLEAATPLLAGGVLRSAEAVREAIFYQLQERLLFVKPTDPYVADLLFGLAVLNANLVSVESARDLIPLAAEYGYPHADRLAALQASIDHALWIAGAWTATRWVIGLATCGALLRFAYKRKWFFWTARARDAHRAIRQVH